ncbi:hypothetical protein EW146_g10211, partial [Bondarzewia mesenterica]
GGHVETEAEALVRREREKEEEREREKEERERDAKKPRLVRTPDFVPHPQIKVDAPSPRRRDFAFEDDASAIRGHSEPSVLAPEDEEDDDDDDDMGPRMPGSFDFGADDAGGGAGAGDGRGHEHTIGLLSAFLRRMHLKA